LASSLTTPVEFELVTQQLAESVWQFFVLFCHFRANGTEHWPLLLGPCLFPLVEAASEVAGQTKIFNMLARFFDAGIGFRLVIRLHPHCMLWEQISKSNLKDGKNNTTPVHPLCGLTAHRMGSC